MFNKFNQCSAYQVQSIVVILCSRKIQQGSKPMHKRQGCCNNGNSGYAHIHVCMLCAVHTLLCLCLTISAGTYENLNVNLNTAEEITALSFSHDLFMIYDKIHACCLIAKFNVSHIFM